MGTSYSIANSSLRICIDRAEGGNISGEIYSQRLTRPMHFGDVGSLFLKLEGLFEEQNYPQAFQRMRSFGSGKPNCPEAATDTEAGMPQDAVRRAEGAVMSFDLYVLTRRYASWQGFVVWEDKSRTEFDSALEILHLLGERLEELKK